MTAGSGCVCAGCLADLLGIVESVLYAKRLPDGLFNLSFFNATGEWPRQTASVSAVIRKNAAWTKDQDEQVPESPCPASL